MQSVCTGSFLLQTDSASRTMPALVQNASEAPCLAQVLSTRRVRPGAPFGGLPMESALRPTGIEGIGPQPWGTHFCLFYETKKDLLELLIPYFKAGLENHEFCLCVASEPVIADEVERALKYAVPDFDQHLANGQIEIVSQLRWYLADGHFDPLRVRQGWIEKLEQALARGYAGM